MISWKRLWVHRSLCKNPPGRQVKDWNTWLEMQFPQESVPLKAINDTQIQPFATQQLEKTEIRFCFELPERRPWKLPSSNTFKWFWKKKIL